MDGLAHWIPAATAVGIGLLIGLERERKKGEGERRSAVGLRTCAVTALLGQVAMALGGVTLLAALLVCLAALLTAAYLRDRDDDPGITTEVALLLTACLGALCSRDPGMAVALAVVLTAMLALRDPLHHIARRWLSDREARDGLILATAALVILPLLPDRYMGPLQAINPHVIWKFTVLLMAISAVGHLAVRLIGPRQGLAIAGFVSGFASSTATIATMGARARDEPALLLPCATGAVLSTVATLVQMALILLVAHPPTLAVMSVPLLAGGLAALLYAGLFARRNARHDLSGADPDDAPSLSPGSMFNLRLVLLLTLAITAISLLVAGLLHWQGEQGVTLAALLAGFADAHSPAISLSSLAATGHLTPAQATLPLLAALTSNSLSKAFVAWTSGGQGYFWRVVPGLALVLVALWGGVWLTQ